jgi:hypothetical protein
MRRTRVSPAPASRASCPRKSAPNAELVTVRRVFVLRDVAPRAEHRSGADEWLDFLECRRESVALDFEVVASLEVQPKSLGGPEVPREA